MVRNDVVAASFRVLALLLLFPISAWAQGETGTIAGVVKDATGAVLPGVTVEASSPALIERVRTVVTDADGLYKIINLRSGTYTVTFTLTGFNTLKREGIDLSASFTASVNADLRVGTIEETVTVSGQAPVVDVQNVLQQKVVTRDLMDSLPTAKTFGSYAVLVPGVTVNAPDVGGAYGDLSVALAIHGSRPNESQIDIDGMPAINGLARGGGQYGQFLNNGMMQEISVETGGMSAESELSGVRSNVIPREGGNTFKGVISAAYTNRSLNSSNVSPELLASGLTANRVGRIYDFNPSAGGRITRDKLWFFLSFREWGTRTTRAGPAGAARPNQTPGSIIFTPDPNRFAFDHTWHLSISDRLTWQVSRKNKITAFYEFQNHEYEFPTDSVGNAPETRSLYKEIPQYLAQVGWSSPVTNRLLLEAGATLAANDWVRYIEPDVIPGVSPITELSTNFTYRAGTGVNYGHNRSNQYNYRASATYVTGSHAFKTGIFLMHTWAYTTTEPNNPVNLALRNGIPVQIQQWATPISYREKVNYNLGLYAQDRWTRNRLTLNLGVRSDFLNAFIEPQSLPAGPFVTARDFPGLNNIPNWKDISPRLGMSYDLFGNGKTAVKVNVGRYMIGEGIITFTRLVNPVTAAVPNVTRTWHDDNRDFVPNCDLVNPFANGECEQMQNLNFGKTVPTTRYADDVSQGFGVRSDNWEGAASIQHEFLPGMSVNATYTRRWYGKFRATQNLAVTNADFSPYCITVPVDPRLPGGGGNQLCGFYDVSTDKLGKFDNVISQASHFGKQEDVFDGIDLVGTARMPRGMVVSGGVSVGRERINTCYMLPDLSLAYGPSTTVTTPRLTPFCDTRPPFQPNVKFLGVYPLPWWGLQTSATFQSVPGPPVLAQYAASNREIVPTLGRNLSAGSNSSVLVDLVPPGTMYGDRLYQLDFRLTKMFKLGPARVQGNFDLYNLLNASPFLTQQNRYGSAWQNPTRTLIGRLGKFSLQVDF
jgi:carboxypeptidase family protein/TonB-dependent receptor-like protein